MGADAVAIISDIHLADDGDVSKIFDYTAGICAVSEAVSVPVITSYSIHYTKLYEGMVL